MDKTFRNEIAARLFIKAVGELKNIAVPTPKLATYALNIATEFAEIAAKYDDAVAPTTPKDAAPKDAVAPAAPNACYTGAPHDFDPGEHFMKSLIENIKRNGQ